MSTKQLWLPASVGRGEKQHACFLCGGSFPDSYIQRHVEICSDEDPERVMNLSSRHRLKELYEVGDKELDRWVKKHRDEILEGRKTM